MKYVMRMEWHNMSVKRYTHTHVYGTHMHTCTHMHTDTLAGAYSLSTPL